MIRSPGAPSRARDPGAQDQPHPGGGDEDLVRRAPGHHLGVAGGDLDAALRRGLLHGRGNGLEDVDLQTLFQDKGGGQGQGPGRGGEQVVHRARHRQATDVAAGKKERVHHEGIGGEGQPVGAEGQGGAIVTGEVRGAVAGQKDLFDEGGHLFAAGSVTEKDLFHVLKYPYNRQREVLHYILVSVTSLISWTRHKITWGASPKKC